MAIDPLIAARITYLLGWTNLAALLLVLASCRCILGRWHEKLTGSRMYMKLYRHHCHYWWFFIISVLLHSVFAITAFGIPF